MKQEINRGQEPRIQNKEYTMAKTPTPHNSAKLGEIAKTVLMPGDPLRAKFIAENFLENPKLVNKVRNMFAYTGTYQGKEVTVMGSGMGMPSIGIYSYELFNFYDVDQIIRIGSAGALGEGLQLYDIVIGQAATTNSNYFGYLHLPGTPALCGDFGLIEKSVA
jgi:purine-nucleoside phosphorylase